MALEIPYLAAENSAQERRSRSLYRFIVVSPIALLLTVGLVAHLNKPPHAGSAGDAEYDRRVLAYRERVLAGESLVSRNRLAPSADLQREARAWVAGFSSGRLQPLPPAAFEDHLRDGVRGEIMVTSYALASQLTIGAARLLADREPSKATDLALLAAETATPLGYSELIASVESDMTKRRALQIVVAAWPKVPASSRLAFRARIGRLKVDLAKIDRMGDAEKLQLEDYFERQRLSGDRAKAIAVARTLTVRRLEAAQHGARSLNALLRTFAE